MSTRVLLADPDQELLAAYRARLDRDGFVVEVTTAGPDCLAKYRQFRPDVLVLDPVLPWGCQEGLAALVPAATDGAALRLMLVSARYDADQLPPVHGTAVSAFYLKPIAPDQLADCVRRLLRRGTARWPAAPTDERAVRAGR